MLLYSGVSFAIAICAKLTGTIYPVPSFTNWAIKANLCIFLATCTNTNLIINTVHKHNRIRIYAFGQRLGLHEFSSRKRYLPPEYIPQTLIFGNIKHDSHPRQKNYESSAAVAYERQRNPGQRNKT